MVAPSRTKETGWSLAQKHSQPVLWGWLGINHRLQLTGTNFQWEEKTVRNEKPSCTRLAASLKPLVPQKAAAHPLGWAGSPPALFLRAKGKATDGRAEAGKSLLN